ncbi:MAG: lipid II flippase Amj family protein, partial [bacterium]|nr:lipid II flippase Amj family protein [bacterium]
QLRTWTKGAGKLPKDFLLWNVFATAVWTVGALCALYVSALEPAFEATSVLLSGLVNSFAAIAFALLVDPKAAVITDQAVKGERPEADVKAMSFYLGLGNFCGGLLGLAVFPLGSALIRWATLQLGHAQIAENMWLVIALNVIVYALMCTTLASRVSAVITKSVATSLAIYNVFFLVTRLMTQVYAPILGAVRDSVVSGAHEAAHLLALFRWVIFGAAFGCLVGWLLLATFVEIYNKGIAALEKRNGSMPAFMKALAKFSSWKKIFSCLRAPSNLGVGWKDIKVLPKGFLLANIFVIGVHCIGVLAAIQAGAQLSGNLARTATLLSSVINGVATILGSLVVDPTAARITDQGVSGERPLIHIKAMVIALCAGSLIGAIVSQLLFVPSADFIVFGAKILDMLTKL